MPSAEFAEALRIYEYSLKSAAQIAFLRDDTQMLSKIKAIASSVAAMTSCMINESQISSEEIG